MKYKWLSTLASSLMLLLLVLFGVVFFFPLVYRQHHYLAYVSKRSVNRESIGIFNICDAIVWFLDKILLYIW